MEEPTAATPPRSDEPERASALIFNDDGAYLLHLRDERPGIAEPGSWSLLGGVREPADRTPAATIRRELAEEAGLDLPELRPLTVVDALDGDGAAVSVHVFAARWNGEASALPLTEGVMLHWFAPRDVSRLRASPRTRDLVRRHAARRADGLDAADTLAAGASVRRAAPAAPTTGHRAAALDVVGVHLYLQDGAGNVLLGLRHPDAAYASNTWHLLAGHCEQESALSCLVREAEEEAGLIIEPEHVELAHVVHVVDEPGGRPRMQVVFRAHRWTGEPELREPDKCTAWHWWPRHALPERLVPYARAAIDGIRVGRLYTEQGWS